MSDLHRLLHRGVAEIIVEEELDRLLEGGEPLRLKQGFDPSRSDIHLGHVVGLRKLRQFQEMGHKVILIVGDWTAQIGDPSGQSNTRTMLSHQEVLENADTYMKQFFKVVDKERTEVRWQSEWFQEFKLEDVVALTRRFTVAQLTAREDFARRLETGRPVAVTELLYPLLQAYDSVMIQADVEFGGTDQKFNCLVGRELQRMMGQRPQQVFLMPILPGTDGKKKMSKSLDNYIGVDEPPTDMFGKVMSIPDDLILPYFELLTDVSDKELKEKAEAMASGGVNPMEFKMRLGEELVIQFHTPAAARGARDDFTHVFQRRNVPEGVPKAEIRLKYAIPGMKAEAVVTASGKRYQVDMEEGNRGYTADVSDVLDATGIVQSKSEAKRLLSQGAVEVDGQKVTDRGMAFRDGSVIKVGKQRFVKLVQRQEG